MSNFGNGHNQFSPGFSSTPGYNCCSSVTPVYEGQNGSINSPYSSSSAAFHSTFNLENRGPWNPYSESSSYQQRIYGPYYRTYNNQNIEEHVFNDFSSGMAFQQPSDFSWEGRQVPNNHYRYEQHNIPDSPRTSESTGVINSRSSDSQQAKTSQGTRHPQSQPKPISPGPLIVPKLERVFIWDLDETIAIFQSLLTGSYATKYGKDTEYAKQLGYKMETLIFELADRHLFFRELENYDQAHISDFSSDNDQEMSENNSTNNGIALSEYHKGTNWPQKLTLMYRKIKDVYNSHRSSVEGLLGLQQREELIKLHTDIEDITDSWLSLAVSCLNHISVRNNYFNVVVTTTQLVPALAKILLFGLGNVFPIENVYSATKIGKQNCFERITNRFGTTSCTYVVIGDGQEEEAAAKQMNFPFWKVSSHTDLISLYNALTLGFL